MSKLMKPETKSRAKCMTHATDNPSFSEAKKEQVTHLSDLLNQVSHPTRLQILLALADGELPVAEIRKQVGHHEPGASDHLASLRHHGFISQQRHGETAIFKLTPDGELLMKSLHRIQSLKQPNLTRTETLSNAPLSTVSTRRSRKVTDLVAEIGTVVHDPESWLERPNEQLGGKRPIDLVGTDSEVEIHLLIDAARHGMFA